MKLVTFSSVAIGLLLSTGMAMANAGHGAAADDDAADHAPIQLQVMMPEMDPENGRVLFAEKGCVACHSVNGVGGEDAVPLDAHDMDNNMNPFELAAKMWRMAPFMIAAQEEAFGEQILFDGDELADIIAFLHSDEEQHEFTESSLSPEVMEMMDHGHGEQPGEKAHAEELDHD